MFCIKCGAAFADDNKFCPSCGAAACSVAPAGGNVYVHVSSHLVWAVLVTILFNTIFGIVAIIFAAQVNGFIADNKIDAARRASSSAAIWIWVSVAVGLLTWMFFLICGIGAALAEL